ncbi:hypothetical protein L7F22_041391 [Adiantum nelumboides]|nr:hypothetical protein [Adiantum nelumboides]
MLMGHDDDLQTSLRARERESSQSKGLAWVKPGTTPDTEEMVLSSYLRRWVHALYTQILPNESTHKLRTSTATSILKRKARDRLLCTTATVSHDVEGCSVSDDIMEEIDFKSFFPAVPTKWNAVWRHGNDPSAETKTEAHYSLVEAQSKVIRNVLNDGVWDVSMQRRLGPFLKILTPALVARVLNQLASTETAQSFFNWVAEQEGYRHDGFVYNALMLKLGQAQNFTAMEELVNKMQMEEGTLTSTTFAIIIKSYGKAGLLGDCWRKFAKAELLGVKPDARMYTSLLWVLFNAKKVSKANRLVYRMEDRKVEFDLHTWFTIIQGLCKNKFLADAQKVFDRMMSSGCLPNAHVYNAIILGFCESGDPRKAVSYYEKMQKQGCEPDIYTYNSIIQSYCRLQMSAEAEGLVSHMRKAGCEPNRVTFNVLLQHYSKAGDAKEADTCFMRMLEGGFVDHVGYKIYCSLLRRLGDIDKLVSLAENLSLRFGITNVEVCNAILQYYCEKGDAVEAAKYFNETFVRLSAHDESSYALMINAYCKSGNVDAASSLLSTMIERGCKAINVHYDPVMMGLCEQLRGFEALQLFKEMNVKGIESSSSACDRLLTVLSDAGLVEEIQAACKKGLPGAAKAILSKMKEIGLAPTYACYNKLILSLSKCKVTTAESLKLFEEMLERGLVPTDALPSYLLDSFCRCQQQEVIMSFCRVIIAKQLTIREGSARFLLQQDDESELKKL